MGGNTRERIAGPLPILKCTDAEKGPGELARENNTHLKVQGSQVVTRARHTRNVLITTQKHGVRARKKTESLNRPCLFRGHM